VLLYVLPGTVRRNGARLDLSNQKSRRQTSVYDLTDVVSRPVYGIASFRTRNYLCQGSFGLAFRVSKRGVDHSQARQLVCTTFGVQVYVYPNESRSLSERHYTSSVSSVLRNGVGCAGAGRSRKSASQRSRSFRSTFPMAVSAISSSFSSSI
jgi:hypothetical protein